jgi:hypothetical protein
MILQLSSDSTFSLAPEVTQMLLDLQGSYRQKSKSSKVSSRGSKPLVPAKDNWLLVNQGLSIKPAIANPAKMLQWGRSATPAAATPTWGRTHRMQPKQAAPSAKISMPDPSSVLYHHTSVVRSNGKGNSNVYDTFANVIQSGMAQSFGKDRG